MLKGIQILDVKTGGEVVLWGHWARNGRPWAVEHLAKLPEEGGGGQGSATLKFGTQLSSDQSGTTP